MFWMFFYLPFFWHFDSPLLHLSLIYSTQPRKCLNQAVCHGLCLGTEGSCISVFMFMFHVQCFGCSLSFFLLSPCVYSFTFVLPDVLGRRGIATRKCSCAGTLPHLPLISHRQLQLMASFRAPYLRVWLNQAHQDCRDSCHKSDITWYEAKCILIVNDIRRFRV